MRDALVRQGIDRLDSGLAIVDPDGAVVYTNETWEGLDVPGSIPATVTAGEAYLPACDAIADDRLATRCRDEFEALVAGETEALELEYSCPRSDSDGFPRRFRLRGRVFTAEDGEHVVVEHAEITDEYRTEQTLEHRTETLADVATVISHDIRSPLTAALSWSELAGADSDVDTEHVDRIVSALTRMNTIIDAAVTLARETSIDEVGTVDVAQSATEAWADIDAPDAALVVEDIEPVLADETTLALLFENLLRNAVEYGGDDVTVRVGALADGFYVEDDGPGIQEATRDRIFEPGVTTRSSDDNTGIGLSIVERIVDAHGWEIALADADSGGARFEITGVVRPP